MLPRLSAVGAGMLLGASLLACSDAETTAPRKVVRIPAAVMAANSGLQLRIGSFGDGTKAQWKSGEGLIDAKGSRFQALLLQKATATATFSAAYAIVKGLEGFPTSTLSLLAWEHRDNTHCGGGAPRWNLNFTGATGNSYTVFLGCNGAAHTAGSASGWTRDTYDAAAITAQIQAQLGSQSSDVLGVGGRIASIVIIFDEGNDVGSGFAFIDNIRVNDKVFTSSSD